MQSQIYIDLYWLSDCEFDLLHSFAGLPLLLRGSPRPASRRCALSGGQHLVGVSHCIQFIPAKSDSWVNHMLKVLADPSNPQTSKGRPDSCLCLFAFKQVAVTSMLQDTPLGIAA